MLVFKGIDHLNLNVINLDESIKFYKEVFGFEVFEKHKHPTGVEYALIGKSGQGALALYETNTTNLNHIGIHIQNFDKSKELAKKFEDPRYPGVIKYPHSDSYYILDPNGYCIELSEKLVGGH